MKPPRLPLFAFLLPTLLGAAPAPVHQATGFKIVEPSAETVLIWTRITRDPAAAGADRPLPKVTIIDAAAGEERAPRDNAMYPRGRPRMVFPERSDLQGLRPATRHELLVEARPIGADTTTTSLPGGFVTAPSLQADAPARFAVMSCQQYEDQDRPDGLAIYPAMQRGAPDFMINTGDVLYYDHGPVHALNQELARYHWARMYALPTLRDFHRETGAFFMRDDHDTLTDDSRPGDRSGDLTFEDGLRIFREQTALPSPGQRRVRWGRHLELWLLEGREHRSTRAADRTAPPTVLGAPQIAWLEKTLAESDATFRVVVTATPIVGPDRATKDDNLANAGYRLEGDRVRSLLARHPNLVVVTGDRHWQYVSRDPATKVEEWSVGAASDRHAGGWSEEKPRPQHRFLRIRHGGYLSGEVTPRDGTATLTLRLHDTEGKVVFSDEKRAGK
ncbi:MAG: alkaline phosphatase D family protein [Opitutaceae bacterium]|nr:alkaline phosphatase D family protein [Opitutaceae bacterium]